MESQHLIPFKSLSVCACLAFGAALLTSCASLDPTEDIAHASSLVTAKSGVETGWTSPWFEPAEHWDGQSPLSSDIAVRVALQNNRSIRRQVETIAASRADFVQAHLLPNPIINVAIGFPIDGLGGDPLNTSVVQQLAWLWKRPAAIDAAEAGLRSQILAVSDAALRLVAEVRTAHATAYFAEEAVVLQQDNIKLLDRSAELLHERYSVGEASRLDVNRVELDLRAAIVRLADRKASLAVAKRELLEMLGRADAGTNWLTDGVSHDRSAPLAELDEAQVMQLAAHQRLDVAAASAVVDRRAADAHFEELGQLPDIEGGVEYRQNFSHRSGVFPSASVTPKLFDNNSARLARAESELRQAQIEADRVRQAAIAEARLAWVRLRAQLEVVEAYENDILALAEDNQHLAQTAYEAGETDLTVFLLAQRRFNDARIELIDRRLAAAGLLLELERAAGGSLEIPAPPDDAHASIESFTREPAADSHGTEVSP